MSRNDINIDLDEPEYLSNISLYIKHPNIDPEDITKELLINPEFSWMAGSRRTTPNGHELSGLNKESYWNYRTNWFYERNFSKNLIEILELIENKNKFIKKILEEDGIIILSINLSGKTNIGDIIIPNILLRLSNLGIRLGIEVFPNIRP